jgi:hypothetical protein
MNLHSKEIEMISDADLLEEALEVLERLTSYCRVRRVLVPEDTFIIKPALDVLFKAGKLGVDPNEPTPSTNEG